MPSRVLALGLAIEAVFLAAVLGPFSLLTHGTELTDLGKLTDYQQIAAILITAGLVALFVFYVVAILDVAVTGGREAATRREADAVSTGIASGILLTIPAKVNPWQAPRGNHSVILAVALGFTTLFSLTLIFLYPVTAIDVYNYAVEGHVAVYHHLNPMVTPPARVANDTFVSYAGSWADSTSPYGPIWIILTKLDAVVAGSDVVLAILLLKVLAAMAVVATACLLAAAFRHRGPLASALAVMLFGWNPLVQLEMVGNGHNDAVMTLFLIVALVLLKENRAALGALGVGASVLIKFLTLGAVPLFLLARALEPARSHRTRFVRVAASVAVLVGLTAVAYAPFWTGPAIIARAQAVDTDYLSSIPALIILVIPGAINWLAYPRLAILAIVCLWQANSLRLGRANLAQAMFEVLFVTILVASHFAGWYLALLVAVAGLTGDWWIQARMVVFTFATTLATPLWAYLWYWNQGWMSMTTIHLIVVPLTFLPPLIVAVLAIWRPSGGAPRRNRQRASYLDTLYSEVRNARVSARSVVGSSN